MLRNAGINHICIVVAADQPASVALAQSLGCTVVLNHHPDLGQSHSVQLGISTLPQSAFLLLPVDFAFTTTRDVQALLQAHALADFDAELVLRPVHESNFGHPVLFGAAYREKFLALHEGTPASTVYRTHRTKVRTVPVTNANIHRDVDTAEDLAFLMEFLRDQGGAQPPPSR